MNRKDVAELVGVTAIVGALIFVGREISQDQYKAMAELATDNVDPHVGIDEALRQPEFATVFIKAIDRPGELTLDEMAHERISRSCGANVAVGEFPPQTWDFSG